MNENIRLDFFKFLKILKEKKVCFILKFNFFMKIRKKFENIWYAATKCIVNVFRSFNAIRKIQTSGNSRVLRKSIILFQSNSLLIIFFRSLTHTRNTSPITTYVYYKSLKQRKVKKLTSILWIHIMLRGADKF